MSDRLALQRCWNHASREAIARCPECSRFFCRECTIEHADRIICSGCLARLQSAATKPGQRRSFAPVLRCAAALAGLVFAWILFFSIGRMLLAIPDSFHGDTLWKSSFLDDFNEGANR
ncbi:MAG: rhomboid family protein [Chthoniobacteraceae bacterium]